MRHYLLISRDRDATDGSRLDATAAAFAQLDVGLWPITHGVRQRNRLVTGDVVAVLVKRAALVVATARVLRSTPWTDEVAGRFPLRVEGRPAKVLHLHHAHVFNRPVDVRDCASHLSFLPQPPVDWRSAFVGDVRALSTGDFAALVTA